MDAEHIFDPILNGFSQLAQAACEEVIGTFNQHQFFWILQRIYQRLEFCARAELIARPADKQFWLGAALQKIEFVSAFVGGYDRHPKSNHYPDSRIGAGGPQANCCSEGKSGKDYREVKALLEPVKRGADVVYFANAMVVLSLAQAGATEIKPQYREAKAVERFHSVEDDFVVQGSAVHGMRMAHQGRVCRFRLSRIEQGFQVSCRT